MKKFTAFRLTGEDNITVIDLTSLHSRYIIGMSGEDTIELGYSKSEYEETIEEGIVFSFDSVQFFDEDEELIGDFNIHIYENDVFFSYRIVYSSEDKKITVVDYVNGDGHEIRIDYNVAEEQHKILVKTISKLLINSKTKNLIKVINKIIDILSEDKSNNVQRITDKDELKTLYMENKLMK